MEARIAPKCKKCGERINGKYWKPNTFFVGDTFMGWDYSGHKCRLGIKYFLERTDTHTWWTGKDWTNDPMIAKMFDTESDANNYLTESVKISARIPCLVTEHEFVTTKPEQ